MERIMKKPELIDELALRCDFYKKNMKAVVEALSDIIIEHFSTAEFILQCFICAYFNKNSFFQIFVALP